MCARPLLAIINTASRRILRHRFYNRFIDWNRRERRSESFSVFLSPRRLYYSDDTLPQYYKFPPGTQQYGGSSWVGESGAAQRKEEAKTFLHPHDSIVLFLLPRSRLAFIIFLSQTFHLPQVRSFFCCLVVVFLTSLRGSSSFLNYFLAAPASGIITDSKLFFCFFTVECAPFIKSRRRRLGKSHLINNCVSAFNEVGGHRSPFYSTKGSSS